MASVVANLASPSSLVQERKTHFLSLRRLSVSPIRGLEPTVVQLRANPSVNDLSRKRPNRSALVVKATGDSSESSTSFSIVKSVGNVWDNSEDRLALVGLGFAAIVAFWASANLITAIDKLPLVPSFLEFIGILYSLWFVYRYLLFKPNRAELIEIINKSVSDILGQ